MQINMSKGHNSEPYFKDIRNSVNPSGFDSYFVLCLCALGLGLDLASSALDFRFLCEVSYVLECKI